MAAPCSSITSTLAYGSPRADMSNRTSTSRHRAPRDPRRVGYRCSVRRRASTAVFHHGHSNGGTRPWARRCQLVVPADRTAGHAPDGGSDGVQRGPVVDARSRARTGVRTFRPALPAVRHQDTRQSLLRSWRPRTFIWPVGSLACAWFENGCERAVRIGSVKAWRSNAPLPPRSTRRAPPSCRNKCSRGCSPSSASTPQPAAESPLVDPILADADRRGWSVPLDPPGSAPGEGRLAATQAGAARKWLPATLSLSFIAEFSRAHERQNFDLRSPTSDRS